MNKQGNRIYRLDGVEIDTSHVCLKRNGREEHLRQKTFQVLVYLLDQRERLVTKDELIEHIWLGAAVTDNAIEKCLAEIRRSVNDDSRQPRFIKTVPRAGYRFIGAVEEVSRHLPVAEPAAPTSSPSDKDQTARRIETPPSLSPPAGSFSSSRIWLLSILAGLILGAAVTIYFLHRRGSHQPSLAAVTLPETAGKRSLVVMHFDNQSGDHDLDWLREGLADMMITGLSRSANLLVLSRQQLHLLLDRIGHNEADKISLDEALDIAQRSHAKIFVLGSFARLGQQIRVDAQLHDARDGQLLAAESLVVDQPAEILTQVDLLSFKLASHLGAPSKPDSNAGLTSVMTSNLEAYRYYSLGVEKAQSSRNEEALSLFQKAVALDPNFAMAYARIGYVYGVTGNAPEKGKPYLEKAFQQTDRLTEKDKLEIQAWYAIVNYDYAAAIEGFRRIAAAYPLEVEAYRRLANLLKGEEKSQDAIEVLKQGLAIDPDYQELYNALGSVYSETGRHDEAIAMFQRYVQLAPDEPNSHDSLGLGYQWAGLYDEAIHEYERALQLKPDFYIAMVHLANSYFQLGRYRAAIDEYQRYVKAGSSDPERSRGYFCHAYVEMKKGNLNQVERLVQLTDDRPWLLYFVALERNELEKARQIKETIERGVGNERGLRSSQRPLWYVRGLYALKTGAAEAAIDDFKQALSHRPQTWSIDAFEDCLANAYLKLGRFDEAVAEYQRILKLNPNYPLVHYHLALACEGKGQNDEARAEYQRFLQLWKDADADIREVMRARKALSEPPAVAGG